MTLTSLQALTWGTVTGAVVSALLLASSESGLLDWTRPRRADSVVRPSSLPVEPTRATASQRQPATPHPMPVSETPALREVDPR